MWKERFQIVDELTMLFLTGTGVADVIQDLGVLRMLRLGRIIRLVRMVRLIPELKSMVYLIAASMWSFFWTLMLLVLMMFCVAVYYTEVAGDLAKDWDTEGDTGMASDVRSMWGSVGQSMLSLFQAITGGDDWNNFIAVFQGTQYVINVLIFSVYIAFATLVMLNLVTGVFVEGAQRIIKEDKDVELLRTIRKLFMNDADVENDRELCCEEFEAKLESEQMDHFFKALDLSRQEAKDIFHILDDSMHQTGTLTSEEFVQGCLKLRGPARSVDLAAVAYNQRNSMQQNVDFTVSVEDSIKQILRLLESSSRPGTSGTLV